MRKDYIDNLRIFCILLLFPFHTAMIYNNFGEPFYIHGQSLNSVGLITSLIYPWWMTLLFTIAGISSAYALKRRTAKEYVKERVSKLLIPFVIGIVTIIPVQSYIADVFYNQYNGGYFEHYKVFFTKFTDLTGYDGGFTPAHMWFIFYLFIVSMIMLPIMTYYNKKRKIDGSKIGLHHILPLFLVIVIMTPLLEIGGKSVGEALACFAIGFFLLSIDEVQALLERKSLLLGCLFICILCIHSLLIKNELQDGIVWDIEYRIVVWFGIIALIGIGRKFLNKSNAISRYLSNAAFSLYYFHQSILVIVGYIVLKLTDLVIVQFLMIMTLSFIGSLLCYEICRRFRLTCVLFGTKYISVNTRKIDNKGVKII